MLKKQINDLPYEKKRIAKELFKITPEEMSRKNIVNFANEINTSPSMITRTLKELSFYGWKDFQIFVIGNIIKVKNNTSYFDFYKNVFANKIETTINWIDPNVLNKIITSIDHHKNITFAMSRNEKHLCREYIREFKFFGLNAEFIDIEFENLSIIKEDSVVFIIKRKEKTSAQIIEYLKTRNSKTPVVSLTFGDFRNTHGIHEIHLINDKSTTTDEYIQLIQFRNLFTTVLDLISIKYYSKFVKKIDKLSELSYSLCKS